MEITAETVRRLVAEQLPQWADLPVRGVAEQGNDNRTFRLGDQLVVRLPSAKGYVAAVAKETTCLPLIADRVGVAVPTPVATGRPGADYPYPWSVRRWLPGATPERDQDVDMIGLADDVGHFLRELRSVPTDEGPVAGGHSFHRGCHPSVYGDQVQQSLTELADRVDVDTCRGIWREAVRTAWPTDPVWFHGDMAPGNLLTSVGALSAVIDFGTCGVGDPACDLVIAWTLFGPEERDVFRDAVGLPDDAWARARGWSLWKALVTLRQPESPLYAQQERALEQLLVERAGV